MAVYQNQCYLKKHMSFDGKRFSGPGWSLQSKLQRGPTIPSTSWQTEILFKSLICHAILPYWETALTTGLSTILMQVSLLLELFHFA